MDSRPVFVDPSGRRRRVVRRVGLGAVAVLVTCLGAVVVALAGGPQAPFTHWAAPRPVASGLAGASHARSGSHHRGRGAVSPAQPDPQAGPVPAATPSPRPHPSASPSARNSPVPTNPAGHTPPGRSKSPNPRRSTHGP